MTKDGDAKIGLPPVFAKKEGVALILLLDMATDTKGGSLVVAGVTAQRIMVGIVVCFSVVGGNKTFPVGPAKDFGPFQSLMRRPLVRLTILC